MLALLLLNGLAAALSKSSKSPSKWRRWRLNSLEEMPSMSLNALKIASASLGEKTVLKYWVRWVSETSMNRSGGPVGRERWVGREMGRERHEL